MHPTFTPPAAHATPLVAYGPAREGQTQDFVFKAVFPSRASLEALERDGARVEMWTDLPADGRKPGEWGALTFAERYVAEVDQDESTGKVISLCSPEETTVPESDECALYVKLPLDLHHIPPGHRFSFTYRIVYHNGHINWLGSFGGNGELVVEHKPLAVSAGVSLSEGWHVDNVDEAKFEAETSEETTVAKLEEDLSWSAWAIDADSGAITAYATENRSSAIILYTQPQAHTISAHIPLVLSTKDSATIRISTAGDIIFCPSGPESRLYLQALDATSPGQDTGGLQLVRALGAHIGKPSHLVFSSAREPVTSLLVVPIQTDTPTREISITLNELVFLDTPDRFVIFSHSARDLRNVLPDEQITLRLGVCGGILDLVPVKSLEVKDGDAKGVWDVSVLNRHSNMSVSDAQEIISTVPQRVLPTPPPSPPLVPRVTQRSPVPRLSSSEQNKTLETDYSLQADPVESTPKITPAPISPPSYPESAATTAPPILENHPDALALTKVHEDSSDSLSSYLLALFSWLWRALFAQLFAAYGGNSQSRAADSPSATQTNEGEPDIAQTCEREAPTEMQQDDEVQQDDEPAVEQRYGQSVHDSDSDRQESEPATPVTPVLHLAPAAEQAEPSVYSSDDAELHDEPRYVTQVEPKEPLSSKEFTLPSLSADVRPHDGRVSLAILPPFKTAPFTTLKFLLDDESVPENDICISPSNEDLHLIDIKTQPGLQSGKLTVTFNEATVSTAL